METSELYEVTFEQITDFALLFRGGRVAKDDGDFRPWQTADGGYIPADGKDFLNVVEDHLKDSPAIGVYPLVALEDGIKVWWGCVDFDEGIAESYIHAKNLREVLKQLGVTSWVERSRSKGFHVWVFFIEPMSAIDVRVGLTAACEIVEAPVKEVNPKQTEITERGWGNGVRLPYAANRKQGGYNEMDNPEYSFSMVPLRVFLKEAIPTRITPAAWEPVRALYSPPEPRPAFTYRKTPYTGVLDGLSGVIRRNGPRPEPEKPEGDRSSTLFALACAMATQRYAEDVILKELKEADIDWGGKYNKRPDGDKRLEETVRNACKKVEQDGIIHSDSRS
jgi:hypothetical protein